VSTFHKTWTLVSLEILSRQDLSIFATTRNLPRLVKFLTAFSFVYFEGSQYRMTPADLVGKLRIVRLGTLMPCCAFLRRGSLRTSLTIQRSGLETRRILAATVPLMIACVFCDHKLWQLCVGRPRACRFPSSRFPTCVQLPPIRLETSGLAPQLGN
jgi:hypothetical protein